MTTLVTGADGYLGRRVGAALRAAGDDLILAVRAADPAELARKRDRLSPNGTAMVPLDLSHPDPFADLNPQRVTRIIHAAAVIRFDVDRDTAQRVNVDGTARVREFAERCPRLETLLQLSTLYTAGRHTGQVNETRHSDDAGFVNHYEWSKWAAEEIMLSATDLPVTVVRLPTVIGEDDAGTVGQFNAFHHTLRLYFHGLLTLLPGEPATPLSLASAAFTVAAITSLLDAEPGIYQACPGPLPLGTVIDVAFDTFERDPGFRRRMLPRPVACDRDSFLDMATAAKTLRGGPLHKALGSVAPFAEQLYLPKVFTTVRLRKAWPHCPAPDPAATAALVRSVCTDLIARSFHA